MRNAASGVAGSVQSLTGENSAIASALSYYPHFERLNESECASVSGDLAILLSRMHKANSMARTGVRVEPSPHMAALVHFMGMD